MGEVFVEFGVGKVIAEEFLEFAFASMESADGGFAKEGLVDMFLEGLFEQL